MLTGIVRTEEYAEDSKETFWVIDNVGQCLEESDILQSDVFDFGGQQWRVLLQSLDILDARYIDIGISRRTDPCKAPDHESISWHAGILDRDGTWQYDRSGVTVLKTTCKEWGWVADWPGPEWTYLSLEKNLYMPGDRLTVAVQLRWFTADDWMDKEVNKTKMTSDSLKTKGYVQNFKEVLWTIVDVQRRLEESDTLLSDTFTFGGQRWRVSLQCAELADALHINASFSRTDIDDQPPNFPSVWWQAGIFDKDEVFLYDRSGWTKLGTPCKEWTTVADWTGPELTYLSRNKDFLMPENRLTISVVVCWLNPELVACPQIDSNDLESAVSSPKSRYMPIKKCDVTLKVGDRTFRTHRMILEIYSPIMAAMLYPSEADDGETEEVLHLADCDPKAIEIFLSFAYSGSLDELTGVIVQDAYYLADKYDVIELKEECVRRLLTYLTADTVCSVLALANKHGDEMLWEGAAKFFAENALDVFNTFTWLRFMELHTRRANDLIIRSHKRNAGLP